MRVVAACMKALRRLVTTLPHRPSLTTHSVVLGFDQLAGASIPTVAIGPFSATSGRIPVPDEF